jgi:chromosomal replication initiator protein
MSPDKLWRAALGQLELRVSQGNFLTWFRDTKITDHTKGHITIETPSAFAHEWLSRKYHSPILDVLQDLDQNITNIAFTIRSQTKVHRPIRRNTRIVMKKVRKVETPAPAQSATDAPSLAITPASTAHLTPAMPIPPRSLNPVYTFDSFVIGPNNEVAHAACKAVSGKPGSTYNPLFLYGGVGLGKTHLMHAIGNAVQTTNSSARILYVASEKFINEFVQAIRDRTTHTFKDRYRSVDVLMIDDVQFMAGKVKCQEELFHTFNALYSQNKQIILSSDRTPKSIPTFEERLKSRLTGGMLVDIGQPDYETRLAIVQEKAAQSSAIISPESLEYIAKNVQKNVRELEGALNRVIGHCELHKKEGTLEYTEKVLEGVLERREQRNVDSKKIVEAVSLYYNISNDDLCGKCRKQEIVRPRQIAMFLLRHENNASFPSIGQQFGGRDHTTAMHACEKIGKLLEHDEDLAQDITFIKERLYV